MTPVVRAYDPGMTVDDLYRRLQEHLDRLPIPFPATASGVEIRILERLFSRDQALVALALSMIPEPPRTIAKRLGRSWTVDRLRIALDEMADAGLIERMGKRGRARYANSVFVVGIYERQLPRLSTELQRDFEIYLEEGFAGAVHTRDRPQLRTVPISVTIVPERFVASHDDIRGFVRASEGPFAVMDCICRHGRDLTGQPCRQTKLRQTCLTIGGAARGMVESGAARFIAREQMLQLLEVADREGLVLQPQNTAEPMFVCCCCGCCCGILKTAKTLDEPAAYFASNYLAVVDADACAACGTCETRCQMDAIHLHDDVSSVDLARCIGCGLCVTTCATGAIHLEHKERDADLPANTPALYMKIYRDRFGAFAAAKALGKALLRRQV